MVRGEHQIVWSLLVGVVPKGGGLLCCILGLLYARFGNKTRVYEMIKVACVNQPRCAALYLSTPASPLDTLGSTGLLTS
jgi:hypothetical protein